jgi:hypothetical protein
LDVLDVAVSAQKAVNPGIPRVVARHMSEAAVARAAGHGLDGLSDHMVIKGDRVSGHATDLQGFTERPENSVVLPAEDDHRDLQQPRQITD